MPSLCAIRECPNASWQNSVCQVHYWRIRRHGRVDDPRPTTDERFWEKVQKTDGCWIWTGSTSGGYGKFKLDGKLVSAHRFAYESLKGEIPTGAVLDHTCHNRRCVNVAHLDPVTQRENVRRAESPASENMVKTHCMRGHEFTPENTYMQPGKPNRHCRACRREQMAESRADKPKTKAGRYTYATHCVNGHAFAEHGFVSGKQRRCRICHNATSRRSAAKRRAS